MNCCATTPKRTYVPDFVDLAHAAVSGIEHDDFTVRIRFGDDEEGIRLAIESETRHHAVPSLALDGSESMAEILELALGLIQLAMVHDAAYRFRFHGAPIFATAAGKDG